MFLTSQAPTEKFTSPNGENAQPPCLLETIQAAPYPGAELIVEQSENLSPQFQNMELFESTFLKFVENIHSLRDFIRIEGKRFGAMLFEGDPRPHTLMIKVLAYKILPAPGEQEAWDIHLLEFQDRLAAAEFCRFVWGISSALMLSSNKVRIDTLCYDDNTVKPKSAQTTPTSLEKRTSELWSMFADESIDLRRTMGLGNW